MKVFVCTLLYFFSFGLSAEKNFHSRLNDSTRWVTLSVRTSFIFNRGFSHQLHQIKQTSQGYNAHSESLLNGFLPGFEIAGTALLKSESSCRFFMEVSYSFTQGQYRYFYSGMTDTEGPLYKSSSRESICKVESQLLNLGAGLRWTLAKNFFYAMQLNLNSGFNVKVHEKGTITDKEWTNFPVNPAAPPNINNTTVSSVDHHYNVSTRALSFRISAGYELKKFGIQAFRNFGIGWSLPWWGLGFHKNF